MFTFHNTQITVWKQECMHIYGIKTLIRERDPGSLKLFNDYVIPFDSIISILAISHFYISLGFFIPLI